MNEPEFCMAASFGNKKLLTPVRPRLFLFCTAIVG